MSANNPITVLLVDDHPVVREGLNAVISAEPDMVVAGEAETGAEAVEAYARLKPSVMLLDLLLPDMNGVEVIRRICGPSGAARIVVLTSVAGDEEIHRALEAGARGYLFKDMVRKDLVQAVRSVHDGRRYIPATVGVKLAESLPRVGLTSREIEVLQLIASGMRNKEIAFKLNLSEATVNAHVKRILEKLNASDRTHAVTTALRRGFIHL